MNEGLEGIIIAQITKNILSALQRDEFEDWYRGRFDAFITGELAREMGIANSTVETLMMQDIQRIFKLV
jgi:hypothetical protein